jgi:hypothetical protein
MDKRRNESLDAENKVVTENKKYYTLIDIQMGVPTKVLHLVSMAGIAERK